MDNKLLFKQKREEYRTIQMSPKLDISIGAIPLHRYCIASTPRSGSTLISRMLLSSHQAGDPREYLNPLLIQAWYRINQKKISFSDYIEDLERRRTSKNGFFGIKIHGKHLEELEKKISPNDVICMLENFDKFIFVSRRDKINQAISYYIARLTGVFHSDQEQWLEEFDIPQPEFNPYLIIKHLSDILRQEKIWEILLEKINKPILRITYEDMINNYPKKSKEIFDFLGINITQIPELPTKEMKKNFSSEYRNLLLKKIGIDDSDELD